MRRTRLAIRFILCMTIATTSCQKETDDLLITGTNTLPVTAEPAATDTTAATDFITYTILGGQQYCEGNTYPAYTTSALHFKVMFDSSAIYLSKDPNNQYDYNKLYGFSDNMREHHAFSARFGWRWCSNQLQLSAYTYNDSVRTIKDIGSVPLNKENDCAILVKNTAYYFVLNGDTTVMERTSKTSQAIGYKLLPYFGGDEVAPHTIHISIKEIE